MRTEFDGELRNFLVLQLARLHSQLDRYDTLAEGDPDNIEAGRLVLGIIKEISETAGVKASIKHELTGKDGGPIHVTSSIDLSKLSTEELLQFELLMKKANPNPNNAA
jgi:hypothetical protein